MARQSIWMVLILLMAISCNEASETASSQQSNLINANDVRAEIEAQSRKFMDDFRNKDSVAVARHYASDGMLGTVSGHDSMVTSWHHMIQWATENGSPNLHFEATSLSTDDEYVIDLGTYSFTDEDGVTKEEGKYVVVWKKEDGQWKIYRDWTL